jgi:hypothetical protein
MFQLYRTETIPKVSTLAMFFIVLEHEKRLNGKPLTNLNLLVFSEPRATHKSRCVLIIKNLS